MAPRPGGAASRWPASTPREQLCSPTRWRDGIHWDSPNQAAEKQGPRNYVGLQTAWAGSNHVGTSSFWKVGGQFERKDSQQALCFLPQKELSSSGLPPCDVVFNLAGENILNPLRRSAGP